MSEDRFEDLLGPYVLGELTAEERREVDLHLLECPGCRAELERVGHAHNLLRRASATGAPPPDLKGWVLARASAEPRGRTVSGGRLRLWSAAAALLVCAILGVGVYWFMVSGTSEGLPLTATAVAPGASGELRGERAGENLRVELEVWDLPQLGEGEYYEMWYAKESGGRVSCGTFSVGPDGDATVDMSAPAHSVSYPEVEVTREPDDGDPGSSGDTVLVGDLRDI